MLPLLSIAWIIGLTEPFATVRGFPIHRRDVILLDGRHFLIRGGADEMFEDMGGTPAMARGR